MGTSTPALSLFLLLFSLFVAIVVRQVIAQYLGAPVVTARLTFNIVEKLWLGYGIFQFTIPCRDANPQKRSWRRAAADKSAGLNELKRHLTIKEGGHGQVSRAPNGRYVSTKL